MADRKCAQFRASEDAEGAKKSGSCHKFKEPDGMANVDLKDDEFRAVEALDSAVLKGKHGRTWSKRFQKFLMKSLLLTAIFLTCSIITFFAFVPHLAIQVTPNAQLNNSNGTAITLDPLQEFGICIISGSLEECCSISKHFTQIEECKMKLDENQNDFATAKTEVATEESTEDMRDDISEVLNFKVLIAKLNKPIVRGQDIFLDADNTSLLIQNESNSVIVKRSNEKQNFPEYFDIDRINDFKDTVEEIPFYEGDTIKGIRQHYDANIVPNAQSQGFESVHNNKYKELGDFFKTQSAGVDQRHNDHNESTTDNQTQVELSSPNPTDDLNVRPSLNSPYYQRECMSYNPQVGATVPMVPFAPQAPYLYDAANTKFNPSAPVPRTIGGSYVVNSQFVNPSYQPFSNAYPMYPWNPWQQQMQPPQGQYYLCSPIPATPFAANSLANIPGIEIRESEEPSEEINDKIRASTKCPIGQVHCVGDDKCISQYQVCDSQVDCIGASDEISCSCPERIKEERLCDGYLDCPGGEDEIGCFGCDSDSFSCYDVPNEDSEQACIRKEQRCDGTAQCLNGRDEENCSILSEFYEKSHSFNRVSKAKGFLYRNYKGTWYPTCSNPDDWALEICDKEVGKNQFPPLIHMVPVMFNYKGPYINKLPNDKIEIVNFCFNGYAVFVECPPPTCGIRSPFNTSENSEELDESMEDAISRFRHQRSNNGSDPNLVELSRVVGGNPSQPAAWPWVVSIYKNGVFHCGGVIIDKDWIVTAAHCVDRYTHYYYEVEAGILRRFSYSPMQQTRFVTHVVAHNQYDRSNLKNDLALMKLSHPLTYSQYIRPICLPTQLIIGKNYLKEPLPGTFCTAVGWGATIEHGSDPDHLREVEVPVMKHCKYQEDEAGGEICAGFAEGGRDACQGDSGGPFMCKNPNFPQQWYLAGIVSHGEGCARPNEPGVYTKVNLYLEWLHKHLHHKLFPKKRPLQRCPGYTCKSSGKCLPKKKRCDRIADCLLGDDEVNCKKRVTHFLRDALKDMMLIDSSRDNDKEEEKEVFHTTQTEEVTSVSAKPTSTSITDGTTTATTGISTDSIFGTTFKMENSDLNTNQFLYTEHGDTSFATSTVAISDETQSISNNKMSPEFTDIYSDATKNPQSDTDENTTDIASTSIFTTQEVPISTSSTPTLASRLNKHTNITTISSELKYFRCTRMLQIIPSSKRCDKIPDCEDVSDEENCNCAEYMKNFYREAICDGTVQCKDLTDEENCDPLCKENEFHCRSSNICLSQSKRCDGLADCFNNEDELDCFTLADGATLTLDADLRPTLNREGIVTFYRQGHWWPLCGTNWTRSGPEIAGEVCLSMGFSEYESYTHVTVANRPLKTIMQFDVRGGERGGAQDYNVPGKCKVLYVKCSNITTVKQYGGDSKTASPWDAAIYVEGNYKCTGTLLEDNWILTSSDCFRGVDKLHSRYVTILLGVGDSYLDVAGPYEQMRLVTAIIPVLYSDVILLKLGSTVAKGRHVRPLSFPSRNSMHRYKDVCYATGRGNNGKLISIELTRVENCTGGSKCFKRTHPITSECQSTEKPWTGTIVCDSSNGFYPTAVFHEDNGACGFHRVSPFTSLTLFIKAVFNIFAQHSDTSSTVYPQECDRFRCKLGKCLASRRICDGIPDCRDAEDEDFGMCRERTEYCHLAGNCDCLKDQLTCSNSNCQHKSKFCNKIDDCGDGSDEPDICSCYAYLKLTNPEKICDGIRNCYDRTDENPDLCKCDIGKFMCTQNQSCVPMEMVCDGHSDCPQGEDEQNCVKMVSLDYNTNAGEILTRTAGVWHQGCFAETLSGEDLQDICHRLGFDNHNVTRFHYPSTEDRIAKAPLIDAFNVVWLHRSPDVKFKLAIRNGDRPYVSFSDSSDCYRLFLECV